MNTKLADLIKKRDEYKVKLKEMYRHFHGVKHESAHSELQYSEIKVYEDMLNSVVNEINSIQNVKSLKNCFNRLWLLVNPFFQYVTASLPSVSCCSALFL
jgi:hypothetical protein